jgi:hypothetical protein
LEEKKLENMSINQRDGLELETIDENAFDKIDNHINKLNFDPKEKNKVKINS